MTSPPMAKLAGLLVGVAPRVFAQRLSRRDGELAVHLGVAFIFKPPCIFTQRFFVQNKCGGPYEWLLKNAHVHAGAHHPRAATRQPLAIAAPNPVRAAVAARVRKE